jgi:phosphatidylglycerol:prolipoprotein diacylglycerol transferase
MWPELHFLGINLPTYLVYLSLLYSGLILALPRYAQWRLKPPAIALNIAMILMVFGLLGARSFHVFFENPEFYRDHWTRFFHFWLGGFVYYGGFYLALFAATFYCYLSQGEVVSWLDFFAPVVSLGYGLGRISCFFAGCCYGKACELPWAVNHRHPTQLYASGLELFAFAVIAAMMWKKNPKDNSKSGLIFGLWALLHGLGRILVEIFRDDDRGPAIANLSISTWLSLPLIGLGLFILMHSRSKVLKAA